MSHFAALITIIFCISISGVFSEITYDTFVNNAYGRICGYDKSNYPSPTAICKQVSKQKAVAPGRLSWSKITGNCEAADVKVKLNNGTFMRLNAIVVLCKYGKEEKACATASDNAGIVEYYKYETNGQTADKRCYHVDQFAFKGE